MFQTMKIILRNCRIFPFLTPPLVLILLIIVQPDILSKFLWKLISEIFQNFQKLEIHCKYAIYLSCILHLSPSFNFWETSDWIYGLHARSVYESDKFTFR